MVAVAKIDTVKAGQWLGSGQLPPSIDIEFPARNCAIAIQPADRKDDVKLSGALQRLLEEDGGLLVEHDETNHEIRLRGVNEEHLNTVLARLKRRYGVEVSPIRRRSATGNPYGNRSASTGATRSSPAVTGSLATSSSKSVR